MGPASNKVMDAKVMKSGGSDKNLVRVWEAGVGVSLEHSILSLLEFIIVLFCFCTTEVMLPFPDVFQQVFLGKAKF